METRCVPAYLPRRLLLRSVALAASAFLAACTRRRDAPITSLPTQTSPAPSASAATPDPLINGSGPATPGMAATAGPPMPAWGATPSAAAAWDDPGSYPPPPRSPAFWSSDPLMDLPERAYGPLPAEVETSLPVAVGGYELAAPLAAAPAMLPVYVVGRYPDADQGRAGRVVQRGAEAWQFLPRFSLIQSRTPIPATGAAVATAAQATDAATECLRVHAVLMPDTRPIAARRESDGSWRILFIRWVAGMPVYANKGLAATVTGDGQATDIIGRRRPILARSAYPLIAPDDAWRSLIRGGGRTFSIDTGAVGGEAVAVDRFVACRAELAYVEAEVVAPRQLMRPYYLFGDERGHVLFVPALAP